MEDAKNVKIFRPLLNVQEVAHMLGISKSFVYKLIQTGEIPFVKMGTTYRIRFEDLQEYILSNLKSPE